MPRRAPARSAQGLPSREAELEALLAERDARVAELERALAGARREVDERTLQQAASAEVLRVIGDSPVALQAVLDTIAARAAALCDAPRVRIYRADDELLRE